ncbi:MAG: class I SAM-dependent methyltransferase [Sulfuricellaceae bacterium]
MSFKDHFSRQAADYAKYRPHYPPALLDWLAEQAPGRDLAWDAGTGSGQVAVELARLFERVVATDPSARQINNAEAHPKVEYRVEPAERSSLEDASVDLITVAQALHWFDFSAFYAEAERVLKPGGVLAAWCYGLFRTGSETDAVLDVFYSETVGPYWPPERRLIEEEYRTVPFPLPETVAPEFAMEAAWDLDDLLGYFGTWSAVQRYREERGSDPVAELRERLAAAWGSPEAKKTIKWPVHLRVGRVSR